MKDFSGKLAVITGGGSGMGRALAEQLVGEGCDVAMCDVSMETLAETKALCDAAAPQGVKTTTHICDVADEAAVNAFRDEVADLHGTDRINLLFNNAGIGGGGSYINSTREQWERTFNICWYGVYYCTRAFMPMLLKSDEGHLINTSSVNGFWANLGAATPHTAYSAAKFAVKGFSEALLVDLRMNAPHVNVSVVMPGHIGTNIFANSVKVLGMNDDSTMTADDLTRVRNGVAGEVGAELTDDDIEGIAAEIEKRSEEFASGGLTPHEAATIILDGVREVRWRILVGPDAVALDQHVREDPEIAYSEALAIVDASMAESG